MLFNLLKNRSLLFGNTLVVAASACMLGCTLDPYIITAEEEYTRNFIKSFGLVDAHQDWNMATEATIKIDLGAITQKSVKVYAKHQSKYYIVADLTDLSGTIEVPVDVPEETRDILVVVNGMKYYGTIGETINCADMSRGVPGVEYKDDGTADNPNPALYTNTEGDYTVTVKHTTRGNGAGTVYQTYNDGGAYQYFNTQQISPLISTTEWDKYYSENTKKWTENPGKPEWVGLLPESGVFNRLNSELTTWINAKKAEGQSIVEDFRINTGDDGSFTLFPYYYGTNLKHELGVYLLDDEGNPLLKKGTYSKENVNKYTLNDFISFKIFEDRVPGDLQVQPHYDGGDNGIKAIKLTSEEPDKINDNTPNETPVFEIGTEYDLQEKVRIKRGEKWMTYKQYIATYGKTYHSRLAYHFWVDERKKGEQRPDSFARISNDGMVTPLKPTKGHNDDDVAYANVAIATGLDNSSLGAGIGRINGVEANFTYKVEAGSGINSVEIAESELTMCIGQTKTLTVTLKDKDGNKLDEDKDEYWNKISVTEDWDKDKCHIYKDEKTKTIKIEALAYGEFWPTVYVTTSGWNGISAYTHVQSMPHHVTKECTGNPNTDAIYLTDWQNKYFEPSEPRTKDVTDLLYEQGGVDQNWEFIGYTNEGGAWATRKLDKDVFKDITSSYKIKIKIDSNHKLQIRGGGWETLSFDYYVAGDNNRYSSDNDSQTIEADEFEVLLNDAMLAILKENGLSIFNNSGDKNDRITYNKVELVCDVQNDWKANGKENATEDLTAYYKGKAGTTCYCCGDDELDFSNITPEVKIEDDADFNKIHYTVTWSLQAGDYTVSRHRPAARSRSVSSREYFDEIATDNFLKPGYASDWKDVNSFWSRLLPHQEEVASYPPNVCMLARTRGYDVTITYGTDEKGNPKPWKGNLGMYLKVLGSYDIVDVSTDYSGDYRDKYTEYTGNNVYVVFSQNRFNKAADGTSSNQISALSVKHPMSKRTFLTFEDMRLTSNGVNPAHFWERSSDRDVNDLIFNITNYGGITNDDDEKITEDPEEPTDEAFSWLWAVEDLGSTDDFDFNDMVMKITSVTSNVVKKDADGKETGTTTLYKKVTFTPLCAGGTLPIYVHYAPEANGPHYILRPGAYEAADLGYVINDPDLTEIPASITTLLAEGNNNSSEIHRWFGVDDHTVMINTQTGSGVQKAESCVLYLTTGFTITGFGKEGSAKGHRGGLYVTVNDGRSVQYTDEITSGWQLDDTGESWVIVAPKEGQASQMFMIVDADTPWRWPLERCHILNPYPHFTEWVGSNTVETKWYELEGGKEGYTYPRYDLK